MGFTILIINELLGQISEQEGYDQDVELWMERDKKDWF